MAMVLPIYFEQHEPQICRFWPKLTNEQQNALESQLKSIDFERLKQQKELVQQAYAQHDSKFQTFNEFAFSGNRETELLGEQLINEGKLGCLLLAGGQGTRLQSQGPKGIYPISVIKHKSLFQLCAEKVYAASKQANRRLSLAIMTSPENDKETRLFFEKHHYFNLDPGQVSFFVQETLPLLNADGQLFLENPCTIAMGPDGNGYSLLQFVKSGIFERWLSQGIKYVNLILIDNPLANPFDPELVGFHQKQEAEITFKCTEKMNPEEKVGLLVKEGDRCRVVEYSEIPESEKKALRSDGRLKHCCANLSLLCFSMSFIQHITTPIESTIPLHKSWKRATYLDENLISHVSQEPIAWKFETFIFDWISHAEKIAALVYPREECFAPLKNLVGADSPSTVQEALQNRERKIIESLTGLPAPLFPFELAAEFYYPTPSLRAYWKGKSISSTYIEP